MPDEVAVVETTKDKVDSVTTDVKDQDQQPTGRWFDKLLPEEAEARTSAEKTYSKYKSQEDALASIPSREKLVGAKLELPDPSLTGEEAIKAHRTVLKKMGSPTDPKKYDIESLTKELDPDLKARILERAPDYFEVRAQEAAEMGLLPWQFEQLLARGLAQAQGVLDAERTEREEADREKRRIWGTGVEKRMGEVFNMAAEIDNALFAQENAKLPDGVRSEKGGIATQLIRNANSPTLDRMMHYFHDRLMSEGGPPIHGTTPAQQDAWTTAYNQNKQANPNRGDAYWRRYADEVTGVKS